jgi:hypothetical protein
VHLEAIPSTVDLLANMSVLRGDAVDLQQAVTGSSVDLYIQVGSPIVPERIYVCNTSATCSHYVSTMCIDLSLNVRSTVCECALSVP